MSGHQAIPQPYRSYMHQQSSAGMREYASSPLNRSTADLLEGVTHEYEPDCDADGFRHPGNHHAEHHGDFSPGITAAPRPLSKGRSTRPHPFAKKPAVNPDGNPATFTFEHEPDCDAEGYRHHHENLSSPALRALQDVVVPLDPRAGRIVITPSPSLKSNYSPYRHIDELPNKSIEDLQDPIELHSHASMIYGVDENTALDSSGPDWMEIETTGLLDEAAHGDIDRKVSARPVDKHLHIDPSGRLMAPVGGIAGDRRPTGPTRVMQEKDAVGIRGAYTADGEGSAGLPFDANTGNSKIEGDISVKPESVAVPADMIASSGTTSAKAVPSLASSLKQTQGPQLLSPPGPVEDIKLPEKPLSQDGSAMQVSENAKDERPEWLRAAEMMANNEHEKLAKSRLVIDERASEDTLDFASAARANLIRDSKSERGASYPNLAELNVQTMKSPDPSERQGVSHLPEKDLGGANPPTETDERTNKFAVETESKVLEAKPGVEPATAAKFLGLSSGAAAGASLGAAALMTTGRDIKSGSGGETKISESVPQTNLGKSEPAKVESVNKTDAPSVPKTRPPPKKVEGFHPIAPVPAAQVPTERQQPFSLDKVVRPNIMKLTPYRCARDDYNGPGYTFLDANENSFGPSLGSNNLDRQALNRYPDPNQVRVKELICDLRGGQLKPENLFIGVGSDEAIDCIIRVFCVPGKDKILITPPTYGMYSVSATINDVEAVKVPLDPENSFQPRTTEILETLKNDSDVKIVFLCSPGNPTSKLIDQHHIKKVLDSGWAGILVVDEAYIDFSVEGSSVCSWVNSYPNLIVMQTMSKAFGLAAIRLGVAFTSPEIANIMNSLKAPYNISTPTSDLAIKALSKEGLSTMRSHVSRLNASRATLADSLLSMENVKAIIGGKEGNFVMAQIQTKAGIISNDLAFKVYQDMAQKRGVVVRFRGHEYGCEGCLRITVGTEKENKLLLDMLQTSFVVAQGGSEPTIPPRPARTSSSDAQPVVPARPSKDQAPAVPRRPTASTGSNPAPAIPARPVKTNSMPRDDESKQKPTIAPRPVPGKLGGAKSAFAAALEARLKSGPPVPKKKEETVEEDVAPESAPVPAPLADARKGRARGPAKRKPVETPPIEPQAGAKDENEAVDESIRTTDTSPQAESSAHAGQEKKNVSTREQSVQTGVIEISTPTGDVTVFEGAGNESGVTLNTDPAGADYVGQTIVVPKQGQSTSDELDSGSIDKSESNTEDRSKKIEAAEESRASENNREHEMTDAEPIVDRAALQDEGEGTPAVNL